jgi:hypothetical protein
MSIDLTPIGGNPIRNTIEEILRFARLDLSVVQDWEVEDALNFAADEVAFISPESEEDRSTRTEPLRKRSEAYLATSELWSRLATQYGIGTPPKQILQTLSISIGTDFPTPTDYLSAFTRVADRYREQGLRILRMLAPVTAGIEAGYSIDDE